MGELMMCGICHVRAAEVEDVCSKCNDRYPAVPLRQGERRENVSGIFSSNEIRQIITMALTSRPHTREELEAIVGWCEDRRIDNAVVDNVLRGRLSIEWNANEPCFVPIDTGETKRGQR